MNGLELYDRLYVTEELSDVPALLISAASFHFEPGNRPITYMTKPFDLDELLATIEALLGTLNEVPSAVSQIE
jgi:DNA-binding response OmpR family regulator